MLPCQYTRLMMKGDLMNSYFPRLPQSVVAIAIAVAVLAVCSSRLALSQQSGAPPAPAVVAADAMFSQPYVDVDEWRDKPMRHRYVHGGFKGTGAKFSFYFPPKEQFHGRFFQHVTPAPSSENLEQDSVGEEDKIGFSIISGGYFIETNEGGQSAIGNGALSGYLVNAAAAQYSRNLANQMYGPGRRRIQVDQWLREHRCLGRSSPIRHRISTGHSQCLHGTDARFASPLRQVSFDSRCG
jgi:hypothetical protein